LVHRDPARRLALVSAGFSVAVATALATVHALYGSELALAQAADSFSDVLAGALLVWAARAGANDADAEHPHGHGPAEPIAALMVAVLLGGVSLEVGRLAVASMSEARAMAIDPVVAAVFVIKIVFRGAVATFARSSKRSPTLAALRADAIADVLVGLLSLTGFGLSQAGWPRIDAVLAVGVAVYVAATGVRLARDNVTLLMGASAPSARVAALRALVASVSDVMAVDELVATWHGAALHVLVEIAVDGALSVERGHEIAHAVEARLRTEADVARVVVHVGPARVE
jgi:cation diffusion facilitator family transporter